MIITMSVLSAREKKMTPCQRLNGRVDTCPIWCHWLLIFFSSWSYMTLQSCLIIGGAHAEKRAHPRDCDLLA